MGRAGERHVGESPLLLEGALRISSALQCAPVREAVLLGPDDDHRRPLRPLAPWTVTNSIGALGSRKRERRARTSSPAARNRSSRAKAEAQPSNASMAE